MLKKSLSSVIFLTCGFLLKHARFVKKIAIFMLFFGYFIRNFKPFTKYDYLNYFTFLRVNVIIK